MSSESCEIQWAGEALTLLPRRAVWWAREETVLVADVHLGKDQVFRRHGIGLPGGPTDADLAALDALVRGVGARRLVILGDLVHAPPAATDRWPGAVARWRRGLGDVAVELVLGNHDRRLAPWLADWGIGAAPTLRAGPFLLVHEPPPRATAPTLCGHLHPVVKLREGRGSLRLPVFWFSGDLAVLPSFGAFTGGHPIEAAAEDRVYAVAGDRVVPVAAGAR